MPHRPDASIRLAGAREYLVAPTMARPGFHISLDFIDHWYTSFARMDALGNKVTHPGTRDQSMQRMGLSPISRCLAARWKDSARKPSLFQFRGGREEEAQGRDKADKRIVPWYPALSRGP